MTRRLTLALALAVLVAAGCASDPTAQLPSEPPTTATTTTLAAADCPLVVVECPRPWITPGDTIESIQGICTKGYNVRGYLTAAEKRRVLAAYSLPANTPVREWDHLVPRWAGGASTTKNIFPQVDPAEVRRKDALEQRLYVAFCHPGQGKGINPATIQAACQNAKLTLDCARRIAKEYWRWW